MTVKELYNWCKAFKHKDAEIYLVKDWEDVDENGTLTDLYRLEDVVHQVNIVDMGMDFKDEYEVLMGFSDKKARCKINNNNE